MWMRKKLDQSKVMLGWGSSTPGASELRAKLKAVAASLPALRTGSSSMLQAGQDKLSQ